MAQSEEVKAKMEALKAEAEKLYSRLCDIRLEYARLATGGGKVAVLRSTYSWHGGEVVAVLEDDGAGKVKVVAKAALSPLPVSYGSDENKPWHIRRDSLEPSK